MEIGSDYLIYISDFVRSHKIMVASKPLNLTDARKLKVHMIGTLVNNAYNSWASDINSSTVDSYVEALGELRIISQAFISRIYDEHERQMYKMGIKDVKQISEYFDRHVQNIEEVINPLTTISYFSDKGTWQDGKLSDVKNKIIKEQILGSLIFFTVFAYIRQDLQPMAILPSVFSSESLLELREWCMNLITSGTEDIENQEQS